MEPCAYDISLHLGPHAQWPGDCEYATRHRLSLGCNDLSNVSDIQISAHAGTHIEAPAHMIAGGMTIDQFGLDRFILPAYVVDVGDVDAIDVAHIQHAQVAPGEAILFKTRNSTSGLVRDSVFRQNFTHLRESAGRWCVEQKLSLVGVDYLSVDSGECEECPVHLVLLDAGVLILEAVDLSAVPEGRYTLWALPLKLAGCEASPVRAILLGT